MKKILLIMVLLTLSIYPQNLLLMGDDAPIVYDGSELVTNAIDIGFEPTSILQSDFSAGVNGWSALEGTVDGNIDGIGGSDNNLRLTVNTTTDGGHTAFEPNPTFTNGVWYFTASKVYIPSTNNVGVRFKVLKSSNQIIYTHLFTNLDTWLQQRTRVKITTATGTGLRIYSSTSANSTTYTDAGGDDLLYIKDVGISNSPQYDVAGNHTFDSSSTYKQAGSYSGAIISTSAGDGSTNTISLAAGRFTAVTNGTNYRLQVYAYTSTASTTLTFKLGDIVKTAIVSTVGMTAINFDFKATASSTGAIYLYLDKAATVYLDEVSLKSGS